LSANFLQGVKLLAIVYKMPLDPVVARFYAASSLKATIPSDIPRKYMASKLANENKWLSLVFSTPHSFVILEL
jgi:hypothetical protein